ncbi:MAG: hypothetical protein LBO00_00085 [Zoogloeaceae bacterium]|nr:hypothetical protein [Zoogloeaceae bacterium]
MFYFAPLLVPLFVGWLLFCLLYATTGFRSRRTHAKKDTAPWSAGIRSTLIATTLFVLTFPVIGLFSWWFLFLIAGWILFHLLGIICIYTAEEREYHVIRVGIWCLALLSLASFFFLS